MSTGNNQQVKKIFDAIKCAKGFRKDSELAEFLGTTKQNIFNWQKRNSIGDYLLFTERGFSEHYMRTGNGPMFTADQNHQAAVNIVGPGAEITSEAPAGEFSISDMLQATARVLESKTVYRSALASNIRAFDKAVLMEGKMQGIEEEMRKMRAENAERMDRLEKMVLSLGGQVPEKKSLAS